MIKEVMAETEDRMNKSVEALYSDLLGIRTGRASPASVERLRVEYYGTPTQLIELASISAPVDVTVAVESAKRSAWVEFHAAIAIMAFGALGLAVVVAAMFLKQERQL